MIVFLTFGLMVREALTMLRPIMDFIFVKLSKVINLAVLNKRPILSEFESNASKTLPNSYEW